MAFLHEPEPPRGVLIPATPFAARIVAPNPSPMTYHGTNTWLVEGPDGGLTVIDPGPAIDAHLDAILQHGRGRIGRILITHGHADHVGCAAALRTRSGAAAYGFAPAPSAAFIPDHILGDNAEVAGFRSLYTPGHAADHLCFEWGDGTLFTGDHVMGWASSIVSPPEGHMRAYFHSLERLLDQPHRLYLCGHGPAVEEPMRYVRRLLAHRIRRERTIIQAVKRAPANSSDLVNRIYGDIDPVLLRAAERTVLAHLEKLREDGLVRQNGELWHWEI